MKTPKYTDNRYPHGYRSSTDTDIRKTFERIRREAKEKRERQAEAIRSGLDRVIKLRGKAQ